MRNPVRELVWFGLKVRDSSWCLQTFSVFGEEITGATFSRMLGCTFLQFTVLQWQNMEVFTQQRCT